MAARGERSTTRKTSDVTRVRTWSPRLALARFTETLRRHAGDYATTASKTKPELLEAIYRQEPWIQRGIRKHSGDVVKHGFTLTAPDSNETHAKDAEFQAWWRTHRVGPKIRSALVAGHVYGDPLLELEWDDAGASTDEVANRAGLLREVHVLDPVGVRFKSFKEESGAVRYDAVQYSNGATVTLHPDRYAHFPLHRLPGYVHGLSSVEVGFHSALSKIKGDQGIGEILYHSGTPLRHAKVHGGDDDEIDAVFEMLNDPKFQRAIVWDENLEVVQLNPQAIDPSPYYRVLRESIAAAIGLPEMLLVGAQAGKVSGSETNLSDYHADLAEIQRNVLEPEVERLVEGVLGLTPEDYDIAWTPFPADPLSESESIRERVTAFTLLMGSRVRPEAAARVVGLDLKESDFTEPDPTFGAPVVPRPDPGMEEEP